MLSDWFNAYRRGLVLYARQWLGEEVTLVADPAKAGLIGLHIDLGPDPDRDRFEETESTDWLDPAHDDLPTLRILRITQQNKIEVEMKSDAYEFAQLPDGQWYPTRWRTTDTGHLPNDPKPRIYAREFRLRMFPNATLDPVWFKPPAKTPASLPSTAP